VRLSAQPFEALVLLLERAGELVTREEMCSALWPEGTFVDFDHGVNSAMNRIREALGDTAANPRFLETLARRGYRFVAPVEVVGAEQTPIEEKTAESDGNAPDLFVEDLPLRERILARPEELPQTPHRVVLTLFVLLQAMYLAFYVSALANLDEIRELLDPLPRSTEVFVLLIFSAAVLIPVRAFTLLSVLFRAPGGREKLLKLWRFLLLADEVWALAPFLLLHHMNAGLALACATLLVYSPFAQRSLVLMGAADGGLETAV
jgi:DNA-binding winged helix-turn-helix (wHTH) protein